MSVLNVFVFLDTNDFHSTTFLIQICPGIIYARGQKLLDMKAHVSIFLVDSVVNGKW